MANAFALEVCNALEGKEISTDSLTPEQKKTLEADMKKDNFMSSLKMVMSFGDELSSEIQLRLNKAVALKDVEKRAIPVTGS